MNIYQLLAQKIAEFEECTGIKPKYIYIGEYEKKQILKWAQAVCYLQSPPVTLSGSELFDCEILEVKAPNHIGVS